MANYELLGLNEATPQAVAPTASDTGVVTNLSVTDTATVDTGVITTDLTGTAGAGIPASGGIYLGGTAAANLLDDYEEGAWTPVLSGDGTAGTYESTAIGRYIKVGDLITVYCDIALAGSITAGGTGDAIVTGLPFANSPTASVGSRGACLFAGITLAANYTSITAGPAGTSSTTVYFIESGSAQTLLFLPISSVAASSRFIFSMTYFASA